MTPEFSFTLATALMAIATFIALHRTEVIIMSALSDLQSAVAAQTTVTASAS